MPGKKRGTGGRKAAIEKQRTESGGSRSAHESSTRSQQDKESEMKQLASEVRSSMTLVPSKSGQFARRPAQEFKSMNTLQVYANHFRIIFTKQDVSIYQYRIDIEEAVKDNVQKQETREDQASSKAEDEDAREIKPIRRKIKANINKMVLKAAVDNYNKGKTKQEMLVPFYDGHNLMFTFKPLKEQRISIEAQVEDNGRSRNFVMNCNLAEAENIHLSHFGLENEESVRKRAIQAIDIILRYIPTMGKIPIGPSLFRTDEEDYRISKSGGESFRYPLGSISTLAFGNYQSARSLMAGTTVNVDRSATVFYKPMNLINFVKLVLNKRPDYQLRSFSTDEIYRLKKELVGLQIQVNHLKYGNEGSYKYRKFRVVGIANKPANEDLFEYKEGMVSVAQYFKINYGIELKNAHLPAIKVGNVKKSVSMPIDVCFLAPDQRIRKALTNDEKAEMTKLSGSQTPFTRFEECKKYVKDVNRANKDYLYEFGISIDENPIEVTGKVISPPNIMYANGIAKPYNGQWNMNKQKFYKTESLDRWIVVDVSKDMNQDERLHFAEQLEKQGGLVGMRIAKPLQVSQRDVREITIENIVRFYDTEVKKRFGKPLQMILFITADKKTTANIYSDIKRVCDIKAGIASQCFISNNAKKSHPSVLGNLLLKINSKLGGVNAVIDDKTFGMPKIMNQKNIMIVGADVHHPAPADVIAPSIAAVVASLDTNYTEYSAYITLQERTRNEIITKFDEMMVVLLGRYKKRRNTLPDQILVYRDGVSEGQFQHVLDHEVYKMKEAFKKVNPKYNPKVTFVIVQKRHNTRFIKKEVKHSRESSQNIPAGTVIDTGVVHPTDFDYYLCSHHGAIGTSRPAHYYVLLDENNPCFSRDDMYKMTYYLCHIYVRSTKSVSMPAPAFYAHLSAYRAKVHLTGQMSVSSTESSSSGDTLLTPEQLNAKQLLTQVNVCFENKLYYC